MMMTEFIADGLLAAVAGIGFGAISNPPKRAFLYIGILAAIGHALRLFLMSSLNVDIAAASFFASFLIGLFSLLFGRFSRCPMTVLYIPALLPMVPGMYAYKSVFALILFMQHFKNDVLAGKYLHELQTNAVITFSTVFLLALGATVVLFIFPKKAYSMTRK